MKIHNKMRAGSLILMVLIIMTTLVVIAHSMLRSGYYFALLAQTRKN